MLITTWLLDFSARFNSQLLTPRRKPRQHPAIPAEVLEIRSVPTGFAVVGDSYTFSHTSLMSASGNDVLYNDDDGNGGDPTPAMITAHTNPANGTFTFDNSTGDWTYQPNSGFYEGTDSFTYTINNGNGGIGTATVTLNVTNSAPTVSDIEVDITVGSSDSIDILVDTFLSGNAANDDPDGDAPLDFILGSTLQGSSTYNSATRTITYTPPAGGVCSDAPDEIQFQFADAGGKQSSVKKAKVIGVGNAGGPGIYLTDHAVALGFRHTSVLMIVPIGDALESDPRFAGTYVVNNNTYHYATLSAGPANFVINGVVVQRLHSEINRGGDEPNRNLVIEQLNLNGIAQSTIIARLFELDSLFSDDVIAYWLHPQWTQDTSDRNSNGYTHGLLDALQVYEAVSYSSNLSDDPHSGWSVPVETFLFGVGT